MKNLVIVSFPAKDGMMNDLKETLKSALPDKEIITLGISGKFDTAFQSGYISLFFI